MIELKHIERFYPLAKGQFFYVLRDVNLKIGEGDFVSMMAPSGAGKSSLLHVLGLHDHAWTGEYFFEGTGKSGRGRSFFLHFCSTSGVAKESQGKFSVDRDEDVEFLGAAFAQLIHDCLLAAILKCACPAPREKPNSALFLPQLSQVGAGYYG